MLLRWIEENSGASTRLALVAQTWLHNNRGCARMPLHNPAQMVDYFLESQIR
jgi:hypothetical protein